MNLKIDLKKYGPLVAFIMMLVLILSTWILYLPIMRKEPLPGERKAIILCSANDFYESESEDEFNGSPDADFTTPTANWTHGDTLSNSFLEWSPFGNKTPGSLSVRPLGPGPLNASLTYNWSDYYPLKEYALYNISVSVQINSSIDIVGNGARVGIQWLDSSNKIMRTDWSVYISTTGNKWKNINIFGACNNETGNEILRMKLILAFEGDFVGAGPLDSVHYDDVLVDRLIAVNLTDPTDPDPPPSRINSDGFPAQALQVYWILKGHGYTDENIFLMLYHTGDDVIDIDAFDIYTNDLNRSGVLADIDVENDDVNASRFKQELNKSISGSFASGIRQRDQLIIFMTDHGSNGVLPDKNATFHFEADHSHITELEFYNLVKEIDCARLMINVDCCFSGNFLNEKKPIGQSWYNLPNCLFISAASDVFSWYWINNRNPDGYAGSWFFHPFWDQLDQNQTIVNAFNFAFNSIPTTFPPKPPVGVIQNPLMQDNLGINNSWSFNTEPSL